MSYDEREIRVRKNYLEEQNPAICCVCFHSGEELLRELRQQRSVDIVVLSSQLEDMDGYEFLKRLNSLHNRPLLLLQGDDWYSDATASFLRPDGRQYLPERSSLLDLLLDLRSSTDIGIFWVLPFCKQLYAEWGIQQPDVPVLVHDAQGVQQHALKLFAGEIPHPALFCHSVLSLFSHRPAFRPCVPLSINFWRPA